MERGQITCKRHNVGIKVDPTTNRMFCPKCRAIAKERLQRALRLLAAQCS